MDRWTYIQVLQIEGMVRADPPPQLWSDGQTDWGGVKITIPFFWDSFPKLLSIGSDVAQDG